MEFVTTPASPPPQDFCFGSAAANPYATAPSTPQRLAGVASVAASTNPFASADDTAGNSFLASVVTAPPSPNPFNLLPPVSSSGPSSPSPFDLFQHFTSAPASPARAAAIYAHFGGVDGKDTDGDKDDDHAFQPRVSYSMATSAVAFDWEEKPGKPKPDYAGAIVTVDAAVEDSDFEFGLLFDKRAQPPKLTTADELFNEGKILPLKPPPRLLDAGSVGSSPRSPMARAALWSPRQWSRVGSGTEVDPFAAALAKAAKSPSPLGGKDASGPASGSLPKQPDPVTAPPDTSPATKHGWRKKWRLSDLLLFRSLAERRRAGNRSKDPVFKYSQVQQLGGPVKKASSEPAPANGNVSVGKHKKQSKKAGVAAEGGMSTPHRLGMTGCVRLNPGFYRLAKGFNRHSSSHFGCGTAGSATKG